MKIFSVYESMQRSASLCPDNENIKLVIRHSIRHDINNDVADDDVMLTREGIEFAKRFGKELDIPIGSISSSLLQRCVDTCKNILSGNSSKIEIQRTDILLTAQNNDDNLSWESFEKYGIRGIFDAFVENRKLPGLNSLEFSANKILDYIFETGNEKKSVDIFCTHDFQVAMLLLFLCGNNVENLNSLFENWIYMLEGCFLYGNRKNFTLIWRGVCSQH